MRPLPVQPQIDDPMALLMACHDKVRQFSELAVRLRDHVHRHGADAQAREASTSVLRYFSVAAPLHHDDEDVDLYPALMALGDADLTARLQRITAEHTTLGHSWQAVRAWLEAVQAGHVPTSEWPDIGGFASAYQAHAEQEEVHIYPEAKRLSADTLQALAQAMSARRRAA